MTLQQLKSKLDEKKGSRDQILRDLRAEQSRIKQLKTDIRISKKAQIVIQVTAQETQEELEYRIAEPVTLCLKSVFPNPYEFVVNFVIRRERTECDLLFKRKARLSKPVDSSGIGTIDVAGFGSRVAVWSLSTPRSRSLFLLDEPFKHLKGADANIRVIQLVKTISDQLGLQIIMVSDERVPLEEIEKGADRIFKLTIADGVSKVKVL